MADDEFPPEISEAIRSAALEQFGGIVAAAVDEQLRARIPVIEAAIRADERQRIAARMDELATNYPEDVFPPDSNVRDAIGGAGMGHASRNAARGVRDGDR